MLCGDERGSCSSQLTAEVQKLCVDVCVDVHVARLMVSNCIDVVTLTFSP